MLSASKNRATDRTHLLLPHAETQYAFVRYANPSKFRDGAYTRAIEDPPCGIGIQTPRSCAKMAATCPHWQSHRVDGLHN